ncbi:putative periplasmic or secreted lipoprotein [Rhizobium sp. AP16]|nr:putative periplasmic or secreted lipoprotein [Rhizobium sp. AP16]
MIIYVPPVNKLPSATFHVGETAGDEQVMVFKAATFHGIAPTIESENAMRSALECEVANALAVAGGLDASDVTVTAVGQEIRLAGTVATSDEVKRASAVAEAMPGVRLVRNRILVG